MAPPANCLFKTNTQFSTPRLALEDDVAISKQNAHQNQPRRYTQDESENAIVQGELSAKTAKGFRRGKIGQIYLYRRNFIGGFYGSLRNIPDAP